MGVIIGLDIGSSTTKAVAMSEDKKILKTVQVAASDRMTALFGALGRLMYKCGIQAEDVEKIVMTGLGASLVRGKIYGIPTKKISEFEPMGKGALFLTGLEKAMVVNMGTGTTFVTAGPEGFAHVGGSAVGGGTLTGLSKRMFNVKDFDTLVAMAERGNLKAVDWGIAELTKTKMNTLPDYATASNLGKMRSDATDDDVAMGLFNMIYQTAGTFAVFACRSAGMTDAVVTGTLATPDLCRILLGQVGELYGINFIIPRHTPFVTAIGAALCGFKDK